MLNVTYDFVADTAVLIDKSLPAEKKRWARDTENKIFSELSLLYHEDFHGREVLVRREVEYDASELPFLAGDTLAALEPLPGEGKRRCIIFIFHGEDGSVATDTVNILRELLEMNGRWLGRTRIFAFSEETELVREINEAAYMGLWGIPKEDVGEEMISELAAIIYHSSM